MRAFKFKNLDKIIGRNTTFKSKVKNKITLTKIKEKIISVTAEKLHYSLPKLTQQHHLLAAKTKILLISYITKI